MALSWEALGERLKLQPSEFKALRGEPDAPKTRNVKEWLAFMGKFDQPQAVDLPGHNDYDAPVSRGRITYNEALTRERVREQELQNEKRKAELDQLRGNLVTKEQANEMLRNQQEQFIIALSKLPTIAKTDFIAADRPKITKFSKRWIKEIRRLVDGGLNK